MVDCHVVDIDVAGGIGDLGNVKAIVPLVKLAGLEQIFKTPKLVLRAQPDCLAICPQAHRTVERASKTASLPSGCRPSRNSLPV